MRIVRTTSSNVISKSVRVRTPTKTGAVIRSVPIRVTVKTTKVRVVR